MEGTKPIVIKERLNKYAKECVDWPEGTLEEVSDYIQELKNRFSTWKRVKLESVWTGYEDCHYEVSGERPETDEEMRYRIEEEKEKLKRYLNKQQKKLEKELIQQEADRQKQLEIKEQEYEEYLRLKRLYEA